MTEARCPVAYDHEPENPGWEGCAVRGYDPGPGTVHDPGPPDPDSPVVQWIQALNAISCCRPVSDD